MLDDYSPDLFVGRETELEELGAWATDRTVPRRLITLAAPPGYGKSWVLYQLKNRLANRSDLFLIHLSRQELKPTADDRLNIVEWLPPTIKKAQERCADVRDYDSAAPLPQTISHLINDLCQNCEPALRPILIIDDFDELFDSERKALEKQLLEQFWRNPCTKIIIALRDEFSLSSPMLRRGERRMHLHVFPPLIGQEQIQKRANFQKEPPLSQTELSSFIPPYKWTHPKINTYLYQIIRQRKQESRSPLLSAKDLRHCWLSLIKEKLEREALTQSIIEADLKALVSHAEKDGLTLPEFAQKCNYNLSSASSHIQTLMKLSLVFADRHRYQVVDGIREFIQAEIALREE